MADPNDIRARGIRRDIFARHGLEQGVSDEDAIQHIMAKAQEAGAGPAGWANPEERANARAEYAKVGSTPDEVQKRWEESIYLVDPATNEFNQRYLRDKEFLERMTGGKTRFGGSTPADVGGAVAAWDETNNNPLYRNNWRDSGGWKSQEGFQSGVVNALRNPDLPTGGYMVATDIPMEFLQMQGSGETDTARDSFRTATGNYMTNTDVRPLSPAPIVHLPSGSSPDAIRARLAEIRDLQDAAGTPESGERWQRTMGFTPAPFLRDMGDAAMASADPTILFPMAGAAKTLGAAAKISGSGWLKPATMQVAKGFGLDHAAEQGANAAIMGSLGGADPERTWGDYVDLFPEPAKLKSDAEVRTANDARQQQWREGMERRANSAGVSTADAEAYKKLQQEGRVQVRGTILPDYFTQ
jgi:hypothetical protein